MDRFPAADMKPDELIGFSGLAGIAQETGRVVRGVADAGKLHQGYILVTELAPSRHGRSWVPGQPHWLAAAAL